MNNIDGIYSLRNLALAYCVTCCSNQCISDVHEPVIPTIVCYKEVKILAYTSFEIGRIKALRHNAGPADVFNKTKATVSNRHSLWDRCFDVRAALCYLLVTMFT